MRLFFLLAALNDVDVLACNVQNAYINAETKEKVWFRGGDEMGPDKGKVVVIVRALYGLKSSGARWREHMAQTYVMLDSKVARRTLTSGCMQRSNQMDG